MYIKNYIKVNYIKDVIKNYILVILKSILLKDISCDCNTKQYTNIWHRLNFDCLKYALLLTEQTCHNNIYATISDVKPTALQITTFQTVVAPIKL